MQRRFYAWAAAAMLVPATVLAACGDDDDGNAANGDDSGGAAVTSSGMVDADARLTFEGRSYRLDGMEQANLVDESSFRAVGEADAVTITTGSAVFERTGESGTVYTRSAETGSGEGATPALWLRWVPIDG